MQFGDLYRILDADRDEVLCNQYVSRDKMQAVLFLSARGTRFFRKKMNLRFAGLAPDRAYAFTLDGVAYKKGGASSWKWVCPSMCVVPIIIKSSA